MEILFLKPENLRWAALDKPIEEIEAYDIAHSLDDFHNASCVVYFDGKRNKILKDRYRRY